MSSALTARQHRAHALGIAMTSDMYLETTILATTRFPFHECLKGLPPKLLQRQDFSLKRAEITASAAPRLTPPGATAL
jgi:hypothetical protein